MTFWQLLVYNLYRFKRGPLRRLPIIDAVGLLIQVVSYRLDRIDKAQRWTWMYMVVARNDEEILVPFEHAYKVIRVMEEMEAQAAQQHRSKL